MATKTTQDTVENVLKSGKEQVESAVKAGTQAVQKSFEQTIESAKKQLDELIKGYDEVANFNRGNVDALLAASSATAKAAESINTELFALTKKSYESNLAAYKTLASVKTPKEFFDVQSDLVKSRYDEALASANKINSLVTAVSNEAFAPLNARFSVAAEKFSKSFA